MRPFAALLGASLVLGACASRDPGPDVDRTVHAVENGLVAFTTPLAMFRPDSPGDGSPGTLAERMEHYRVPGVSLALIRDFEPAWAKGYGVLSADDDRPVTIDSRFQAASTTKLVTAAIVLRQVEKGILDLDRDVNVYLRTWKLRENEFTRRRKVTLRLLLTHQAGLPATDFPRLEVADAPTLVQVLAGEPPALNRPAIVEYTPGTQWRYSNLGYVVIQQILEDALGQPFSRIARQTVFEPLGMTSSTFDHPLAPELRAAEAMPHDAEGSRRRPELPPTAQAQGGLVTTPSDLAIFAAELMKAHAGASTLLLSRDSVRRMFSRELELDPEMFGLPFGEGLGVLLYGAGRDLVFLHPGANFPGLNCWLLGCPATGSGIVVMTNGAAGEVLAMEIIAAFNRN